MARMVLYSGGDFARGNQHLHNELSHLCGHSRRKRLTYIPYCADGAEWFFNRAVRRYRKHGFTDFHCLPVDEPVSDKELELTLDSDAIYLAGGNTFYFLYHLRRSGVFQQLQDYAAGGGVLAGLSAGAIMLTPNINLAGYPEFDRDENEVALSDYQALDLAGFEFMPHYQPTRRFHAAMREYSQRVNHPVVLCPDGGGVVVHDEEVRFCGEISILTRGAEHRVH